MGDGRGLLAKVPVPEAFSATAENFMFYLSCPFSSGSRPGDGVLGGVAHSWLGQHTLACLAFRDVKGR